MRMSKQTKWGNQKDPRQKIKPIKKLCLTLLHQRNDVQIHFSILFVIFVILFAFLNMKVEIHLCIWLLFLLNHQKLCPVWYAHWPSFLFLKSYTRLIGINTFFSVHCLTHCDLVMPNGDIELGQHWLRYWLVAWRHQAITWTKVDLSSNGFCGIQIRANSQEVLMNLIHNMCSKITLLKSLSHFQGPMS